MVIIGLPSVVNSCYYFEILIIKIKNDLFLKKPKLKKIFQTGSLKIM